MSTSTPSRPQATLPETVGDRGPALIRPAPTGVSLPKALLVFALATVIVLPHLYEVVVQKEHWPFSNYPMWSKPSVGWEVKREMLRGVTADGKEVPLTPRHLYPIPYDMVVVNMREAAKALRDRDAAKAEADRLKAAGDAAGEAKLNADAERKQQAADRIVAGLMKHYNAGRDAKRHDGPAIAALRLYQVVWPMDPNDVPGTKAQGRTSLLYQGPQGDAKAAAAIAATPVSTKITSEFGDDNNTD